MDDPGEAAYEAALAAVPDDLWREIEESLRVLPQSTAENTWAGGQEVRPGVHQVPFVRYGAGVQLLRSQLERSGVLLPYDWMNWPGRTSYPTPESLRQAPVAEAVRYLVGLFRSERFVEGAIDAELRAHRVAAALENMSDWRAEFTRRRRAPHARP